MSKVRSITHLPPADFTPELGNYKTLQPFRYWCQKVLPLVYDDSLSYYELLCKVVDYLNKTMEDVETLHDDVTNLHTTYEELQSYVNDYFSTLDVQEEINNKLDNMAMNGQLTKLIEPLLPDIITNWLNTHVKPTTPIVDNTLTISGAAADSKITGDTKFGFRGRITGDIFNVSLIGLYTIDAKNNSVTNLPDNIPEDVNYLFYIKLDRLGILICSGNLGYTYMNENNTWKTYTDSTLSLSGIPADAKVTGDTKLGKKGDAGTQDLTKLPIGIYTYNKNNVKNPPDFDTLGNYGYLLSLGDISFAIEATQAPQKICSFINNAWGEYTNVLEGKRITFFGDSITAYSDKANNPFVNRFSKYAKCIVQNLGVSGTGFWRGHDKKMNYINQISKVNNPDIICVSSSYNDLTGYPGIGTWESINDGTLGEYMNKFFDTLFEAYPTTPIFAYSLNYWNWTSNSQFTTVYNYTDLYKDICKRRGIPYINIGEKCNIRPWIENNRNAYCPDGTHPNNSGHAILYAYILHHLEEGYALNSK